MATDLTTKVGTVYPESGLTSHFVVPVTIDFTKINSGSTPASEEITFLKLPAKCFVTQVQADTVVAEGGTLTYDVGDQDGAANWFSNVNGNSVASAMSTLITAGKYFSTGPTFRLTVDNAADKAKVVIRVIGIDLSRS